MSVYAIAQLWIHEASFRDWAESQEYLEIATDRKAGARSVIVLVKGIPSRTEVAKTYLTVNSFSANYGKLSRQQADKEESKIAGGEVTIRASVRASFQLE